ncbi:hypothetical protein KKH27_13205 [bacterium]|nr:hypothetical protein [bacterium]MBU1985018.1 hypothetical protein [bacterium]
MRTVVKATLFLLLASLVSAGALALGRKEAPQKSASDIPDTTMTAREGIAGRVEIWEGNFMPMVEPSKRSGQITPGAGRRVRVHKPVMISGGLAPDRRDSVTTTLVAESVCDSLGEFFLAVPPGKYSIFVEEGGDWYYNGFDGEGVQGAVTVDSGKVSEIVIKVTTKASF